MLNVLHSHHIKVMAGGVCPFRLTWALAYHTGLTAMLLLLVAGQGIVLDVYILSHDHTASLNYFWLLPDFLLIFAFVAAMSAGYSRCKEERARPDDPRRGHSRPRPMTLHTRLVGPQALPVYVWLLYSSLLVAKVAVIFTDEIPNRIDTEDFLSPQLLKVTLSITVLVFALLVEGQSMGGGPGDPREAYIRSLAHGTALETLDSVTFLSLLIQADSGLVLPLVLERAILALACLNFFLPGLALVKLSRSRYGRGRAGLVCSLAYTLAHLWLTNFTFLVVRVYLWAGLSAAVSPFVVKNVYHIFSVMRQVYWEAKELWGEYGGCVARRRRVYSSGTSHGGAALNAVNSSADWTGNNDKFEEIDLKQESGEQR